MSLPRMQHPVHTMVLPSTNQKVKFRPYLVKEEKILLIATESNDEKEMLNATKRILENCILEKDFDVNAMTIFDMQYAFIQLRAKSVGEVVDLKIVCKECQHANDYKLNFQELKVEIPENLDFKIPLSGGIGITMRFPTVSILDKFSKEKLMEADTAMELIMSCIENIWDNDGVHDPHQEPLEEQIAFIESLGRADMEKLEAFTNKIPSISKKVEFDCVKCGTHNERTIGGMSDFFS